VVFLNFFNVIFLPKPNIMKKITFLQKALLCLLCLILATTAVYAQKTDSLEHLRYMQQAAQRLKDLDAYSNEVVRNAPIVFEGRVLQAEQYFNDDSTHIYYATLIEVLRIVRGQNYIKVGTVELRSSCHYQAENRSFFKGIHYELPTVFTGLCRPNFPYDTTNHCVQLFFSKPIEAISPFFENATTNKTVVEDYLRPEESIDYSSIYYPCKNTSNDSYGGFYSLLWCKNREELRTYLLKYGLQLDDSKTINITIPIKSKIAKPKKGKKYKKYGQNSRMPLTTLVISTVNQQITTNIVGNTVNRYLEFDIQGRTNRDVKLITSYFNMRFDSTLFGGRYSAGEITVTKGIDIPSTNQTIGRNYLQKDTFQTWLVTDTAVGSAVTLTNTNKQLLHLKLKIKGCAINSGLRFVNTANYINNFTYRETNSNIFGSFNAITADSVQFRVTTSPLNLCGDAFTFSPAIIHGGAGEVLSIKASAGTHFGTTKGNVYFANGESQSAYNASLASYEEANTGIIMSRLPAAYIPTDYWTDTLIRVIVPANISFMTGENALYDEQHAGTGFFRVEKSDGSKIYSNTKLNVRYSFKNIAISTNPNAMYERFYIANRFCQKGIIMGIDTAGIWLRRYGSPSVSAITSAVSAAARYWSSTIGGDSIRISTFIIDATNPPTNIYGKIIFSNDTTAINPTTEIGTYPKAVLYPVNPSGKKLVENEITMTIYLNKGVSRRWWVDTTLTQDKPANSADLFCVLLHEFGHALGFHHSYDLRGTDYTQELMTKNWASTATVTDKAKRARPTTGMSSAKDAVQRMVRESYGIAWRDSVGYLQGQIRTLGSALGTPSITAQPLHQLTCTVGASKTFTVTAAGTNNYYQWQSYSGVSTPNIGNAISNTYTATNSGTFRCLVANNGCIATSNWAKYLVTPTFTMPDSLNICTTDSLPIILPPVPAPLIFMATGAGVSIANGKAFFKPYKTGAGSVTWTTTNPAQIGQAAQTCTLTTNTTLVTSPTITRIKTCLPPRCVFKDLIVSDFKIGYLGCYNDSTRYILQLSKPGGAFDSIMNINAVKRTVYESKFIQSPISFTIKIDSFAAGANNYKLRVIVAKTVNGVVNLKFSPSSCPFLITKVAKSSDCTTLALGTATLRELSPIAEMTTLNALTYTIYPNPTDNYLNIDFDALFSGTIELVNMQGCILATQNIDAQANITLDTDRYPSGVYYLKIKDNNGFKKTEKFVKI
jgi:hypothetical protein